MIRILVIAGAIIAAVLAWRFLFLEDDDDPRLEAFARADSVPVPASEYGVQIRPLSWAEYARAEALEALLLRA